MTTWLSDRRVWWVIALIGISLRVIQYAAGMSVFVDEIAMIHAVVRREAADLLAPLTSNQVAAPGFSFAVWAGARVFGEGEHALRLVPVLASVGAMIAAVPFARRFVSAPAVSIALLVNAVAWPLILHTGRLKPYTTDALLCTLLLLGAHGLARRVLTPRRLAVAAMAGAAAVWLSYPSVFVLAGAGGVLIATACLARRWKDAARLVAVAAVWVASFAAVYTLTAAEHATSDYLLTFWEEAFMPLPPTTVAEAEWFLDSFLDLFTHPLGLQAAGLAGVVFLVGAAHFWRERRQDLFILLTPVAVTALASAFGLYPFAGRVLIFLIPPLSIPLAEGLWRAYAATASRVPVLGPAAALLLLGPPTLDTLARVPLASEEIEDAMVYVRDHWREGDRIYLYPAAVGLYEYYAPYLGMDDLPYIAGRGSRTDWTVYENDLEQLRGLGRVWVVFAHVYRAGGANEEALFLYWLDRLGERLDSFDGRGASAYLYDTGASAALRVDGAEPGV